MPVALERGHQIFEASSRVGRFRKACQRAFDDLLADLQRRIHFGRDRARGIERHGCALDREAQDEDECDQTDQADSKRHGARQCWRAPSPVLDDNGNTEWDRGQYPFEIAG